MDTFIAVGACLAVTSLGRHVRRHYDLDSGPQRLDRWRQCLHSRTENKVFGLLWAEVMQLKDFRVIECGG